MSERDQVYVAHDSRDYAVAVGESVQALSHYCANYARGLARARFKMAMVASSTTIVGDVIKVDVFHNGVLLHTAEFTACEHPVWRNEEPYLYTDNMPNHLPTEATDADS